MPLSGRVPIEINYIPAVTAENVSVQVSQVQKVRIGAYGPYGRAEGQQTYKATITFGVPIDRAEFELLMQRAKTPQRGPDVTYHKGTETYTLLDCGVDSDTINSDQNGNAEQQISLVAVDRIRVS